MISSDSDAIKLLPIIQYMMLNGNCKCCKLTNHSHMLTQKVRNRFGMLGVSAFIIKTKKLRVCCYKSRRPHTFLLT